MKTVRAADLGSGQTTGLTHNKDNGEEEEQRFICFICGVNFSCQIYLNRHIKNVHEKANEEHQKCPKCPMIFKRYDTFWEHVIRVHENPSSSSTTGNVPYDRSNANNLARSNDEELLVAPEDEQELEAFVDSWVSEADEKMCKRCGKTFCGRPNVRRHIKEVHLKLPANKEGVRAYCKICKKSFVNNSVYNAHMRNIHLQPEPLIQCPKCVKKFKENKGLNRHLKDVHQVNAEITTTNVSSEFMNANDKDIDNDVEDTVFSCITCEISFVSMDGLNRHKKNVHRINVPTEVRVSRQSQPVIKRETSVQLVLQPQPSGDGEHKCSECGKIFSTRNNLLGHAVVHQKASLEPHVKAMLKSVFGTVCNSSLTCGICGIVVTNSVEGRLHVYIKHPEKFEELVTISASKTQGLLQCTYCLEKEPNTETMISHIESCHPDKCIPTCPLCGHKELKEREINIHFKNFHPTASRYCCDVCKRTFNQRRELEHHVSREHSANSVQCPYCPEKHVKVKLHITMKHPEKAEEYTLLKKAAIREEQQARMRFNQFLEKGSISEEPKPRVKTVSKRKGKFKSSKSKEDQGSESDFEDNLQDIQEEEIDGENPDYVDDNEEDVDQKPNVCYVKETPKVTIPDLYTLEKNTGTPHLIEVHRLPPPPTPPSPEQLDLTTEEVLIETNEGIDVKPDVNQLEGSVVVDMEQVDETDILSPTKKALILCLDRISEQEIVSWKSPTKMGADQASTDQNRLSQVGIQPSAIKQESPSTSKTKRGRKRRRRR